MLHDFYVRYNIIHVILLSIIPLLNWPIRLQMARVINLLIKLSLRVVMLRVMDVYYEHLQCTNAHYYSCDNLSIEVGGLVVVWSPAHSSFANGLGPGLAWWFQSSDINFIKLRVKFYQTLPSVINIAMLTSLYNLHVY